MKRTPLLAVLAVLAASASAPPLSRADAPGSLSVSYYDTGSTLQNVTVPGTVAFDDFGNYAGFTPDDDTPIPATNSNGWCLTFEDVDSAGNYFHYLGSYPGYWPYAIDCTLNYDDTPGGDNPPPLPEEGPIPIQPPLVPSGPVGPA